MPSLRQLKTSDSAVLYDKSMISPGETVQTENMSPSLWFKKKNLSRDTEQFSLTNPLFSIRSTIFLCLLTIFSVIYFSTPPGYLRTKNSFTLSHAALSVDLMVPRTQRQLGKNACFRALNE